jgi:thioredoxin 1
MAVWLIHPNHPKTKGRIMAVNVTEENFEKEVLQSDKPVIVDVYASWCGPCQQMMPIVEELASELAGSHKFAKLNVDEARDLSVKYGVISVPTFLFIKNGEVKGKETGFMNKEVLKEKIDAAFK